MASIYTHQSEARLRTFVLMTAFLGLVIGLGFLLSYYFQDEVILYVAIIFSIVMNIGAYWFSDRIVLKMHNAKEVTRREYPDLYNVTENLVITAGLPMPKLYLIKDASLNAFATGRNKKHAVVAVTSGLLEKLNRDELEGVVAHELAHVGNNDMLVSTMAVILAGFVSLIADIFLRTRFTSSENRNGGVLILVGIVISIIAPLFATILRLAISRKREYLADASGALLTRNPEGLARALEKISGDSHIMNSAHSASAHLFISNPFKGRSIMNLFSTHPPAKERIKRLRSML